MNLRQGADQDAITTVVAQTDVAYNNPTKGQKFCQPGTQYLALLASPGLPTSLLHFRPKAKFVAVSLLMNNTNPIANGLSQSREPLAMQN